MPPPEWLALTQRAALIAAAALADVRQPARQRPFIGLASRSEAQFVSGVLFRCLRLPRRDCCDELIVQPNL